MKEWGFDQHMIRAKEKKIIIRKTIAVFSPAWQGEDLHGRLKSTAEKCTRNRSFCHPSLGKTLCSFAVKGGVWWQISWSFFFPQHTFLWLWGITDVFIQEPILKMMMQALLYMIYSGVLEVRCDQFLLKIVVKLWNNYLAYYNSTCKSNKTCLKRVCGSCDYELEVYFQS